MVGKTTNQVMSSLSKDMGRAMGKAMGKETGKAMGKTMGKAMSKAMGKAMGTAMGKTMGKRLGVPDRGRRHLGPSAPRGPARLAAYAPRCCTCSHTYTCLQCCNNAQLHKAELTASFCLAVYSLSAKSL